DAVVSDERAPFAESFVLPALMANALYEGKYPLATALGRPLIALRMVEVAKQFGATHVAHGCTGKGNDQVRFDVTFQTLAPHLKIIAPVREWKMTRPEAMDYAAEHGIPVEATKASPYSTDENLWGRSIECGELEDPWAAPPRDAFLWTAHPEDAPATPEVVSIRFEQGRPTALDGKAMDLPDLIAKLNETAGRHGVGRIDMVENRLVGIKSRELYEAPGAVVLIEAHKALETITLSKPSMRMKTMVAQDYADIVYNGLWFSNHHQDLMVYTASTQRYVTGDVRVRLLRGTLMVEGRRSEHSLYRRDLATYEKGDAFNHEAAIGFIKLHGLPQQVQASYQLLAGGAKPAPLSLPSLLPADSPLTTDKPAD
ncbi:MAG: argininosuccinate synthase, partial [Planctomycetia bacterium]